MFILYTKFLRKGDGRMAFNIIMLFSVYMVLGIMYFVMRYMAADNGVLLFGARINAKMLEGEENKRFIEGVKKSYFRSLNVIGALCVVLSLVPIAVPYISVRTLLWIVWIFALIVILTIPQIKCFNEIVKWKSDNGYVDENDDDKYWKWGLMYYNPDDNNSMVEKRVGIGMTCNMAKPIGKVMNVVLIATLVGTVVMCGWLMLEEFMPIHLQVIDNTLQAKQYKVDYKIRLDEINEIYLLEDIPRMSKSSGTNLDNLFKGEFYVPEEHHGCRAFFNPKNKLLIKIKANGKIYYLGGYDDNETKKVYELCM